MKRIKYTMARWAYPPFRAHNTDAGLDLRAASSDIIPPHGSKEFDTGISIQIPKNHAGIIISKSGLNFKYGINATGLIDSGYTGTIKVKLYNHSDEKVVINRGDKITQLVIVPIITYKLKLVDKLAKTLRGEKGFGSSGR